MGKKNWIEFDNYKNIPQEKTKKDNLKKISKLNISKQKNIKIKNSAKKTNIDLQTYKIIFILKDEDPKDPTEELAKVDTVNKRSKINISKQKKGKKGKTITLIEGLGTEDEILLKELLKKIKVFCCTGGIIIDSNIQLQGDMVSKSIDFLRKEGFHNL